MKCGLLIVIIPPDPFWDPSFAESSVSWTEQGFWRLETWSCAGYDSSFPRRRLLTLVTVNSHRHRRQRFVSRARRGVIINELVATKTIPVGLVFRPPSIEASRCCQKYSVTRMNINGLVESRLRADVFREPKQTCRRTPRWHRYW